jgi:FkbM family methyltransferase
VRLRDRLLLNACARFYRFSRRARFTVLLPCGCESARVPIIQGCGWPLLEYTDERIQQVVSRLYNQGRRGYFIDIGANQGKMILNLLALGFRLPYLGFEPDLDGARYIQELIQLNQLSNHHVLPIALGGENSMLELHRSHPTDVNSTLGLDLRPAQMYSNTTRVPVSTADDQLAELEQPIFLVKIDTEGWELNVLRGMEAILREKRPPVYFEVMGYRHLVEKTYPREYFGGELSNDELRRLIQNRRDNMSSLENFWGQCGYATYLCREDGTLHPSHSLDPGVQSDDNRGEMDFLAVSMN